MTRCLSALFVLGSTLSLAVQAQDPGMPPGRPGPGGMGPSNETLAVLARFDHNGDKRLDAEERKTARAWLAANRPTRGRGPGGPGGPGGPPPEEGTPKRDGAAAKGRHVSPADVQTYSDRPLFDPDIVRTFFFEFPGDDWFDELTAFYRTDVEVPAKVTIDGRTYENVGVGFRGNTSFMMAPGRKKSLDLAFDHADGKQDLHGVQNLDLLNCHTDASFLREMVHGFTANQFFPAPRVCLVRVVINGEDHGVYAGVQQFDKAFVQDHFDTGKGDRFKVPPDFSGSGGLRWLGEDPQAYKRNYQLKSAATDVAWTALVDLCSVLDRTPTEELEHILPQHLDVDAMLWFLAMDNAIGDDDGYHSRASDYLLYRDPRGRFHAIPRDNNEVLLAARSRPGGGPGGAGPGRDAPPAGGPPAGPGGPGGRRGGAGSATSPLAMATRQDRPLLRRLLEVPTWKQRYLANLRVLAATVFTQDHLGARIDRWRSMIDDLVKHDAHALYGYDAFVKSFAKDDNGQPAARSLMAVVAQRQKAVLDDPAMQGAWPEVGELATNVLAQADGTYALTITCRAGGAKVESVKLHAGQGKFGAFVTQELSDDGQHADGAAGDGVYGGSLAAIEGGATWRFWLEAVAAESHHVACLPSGGGALPITWKAPKKAGKRD